MARHKSSEQIAFHTDVTQQQQSANHSSLPSKTQYRIFSCTWTELEVANIFSDNILNKNSISEEQTPNTINTDFLKKKKFALFVFSTGEKK